MSSQTATGDDRAGQIVAATRQVMADFGVRRATMGDVARAAGVSRQTVYEYFPSREALVQAALVAGARDVVARATAAAEQTGGDARERLGVLLSAAIDFFRTSPLWSTQGKRAELATFVALEGTVFLGAGTVALAQALRSWWPDAADDRIERAADTLARTLVSHGLAPEEERPGPIGTQLADLVALGLGG